MEIKQDAYGAKAHAKASMCIEPGLVGYERWTRPPPEIQHLLQSTQHRQNFMVKSKLENIWITIYLIKKFP